MHLYNVQCNTCTVTKWWKTWHSGKQMYSSGKQNVTWKLRNLLKNKATCSNVWILDYTTFGQKDLQDIERQSAKLFALCCHVRWIFPVSEIMKASYLSTHGFLIMVASVPRIASDPPRRFHDPKPVEFPKIVLQGTHMLCTSSELW